MSNPDGTVSNLHLAQSQPLTAVFVARETVAAVLLNPGVSIIKHVMDFSMPFYGDVVVWGQIRMTTGAGVQQVDIVVDPSSTPAPTIAPQTNWRTEGGTDLNMVMMPFMATFPAKPLGWFLKIELFIQNGYGASQLQIDNYQMVALCTKT
jgi:hypothetical protein